MTDTVILGLGSSQGNRLHHLRQAVQHLQTHAAIQVINIAPVYISDALLPDNAPADWQTYYLNSAVSCKTSLLPQELLSAVKAIEQKIGRKPTERWAPRIIDIDILSFGSEIIQQENLRVPHSEILHRPFALWPLLDLKPNWQLAGFEKILAEWGDRFSGNAPFYTRQIAQQLVGPELIGVINLTPDSFSKDGMDYTAALQQAKKCFAEGATVLDIGAEATNPNATAITSEAECQRLLPFLAELKNIWRAEEFQPLISIDTYHADTVEKVLDYKITLINDVSTREAATIAPMLRGTDTKYVFMHSLDVPVVRGKILPVSCDPVQEISIWAQQTLNKLLNWGLQREQLIFDPGIGFGNSAAQALEILQRIDEFSALNLPLYVGHSRKSFLNQFTTKDFAERDLETALITEYLATKKVNYLRVHNVAVNNQAIKLAYALNNPKLIKKSADETVSV